MNQKLKNKIYKLRKVDDRVQILQLARSRNKRQKSKRNRDMNRARERWF